MQFEILSVRNVELSQLLVMSILGLQFTRVHGFFNFYALNKTSRCDFKEMILLEINTRRICYLICNFEDLKLKKIDSF